MSARWSAAAVLALAMPVLAADPIRLREAFPAGEQYHVAIREEAGGELRLPAEPGKPAPPPLKIRGRGAFEYDERVLDSGTADNPVPKSLRVYRRVELERTVDDQAQE